MCNPLKGMCEGSLAKRFAIGTLGVVGTLSTAAYFWLGKQDEWVKIVPWNPTLEISRDGAQFLTAGTALATMTGALALNLLSKCSLQNIDQYIQEWSRDSFENSPGKLKAFLVSYVLAVATLTKYQWSDSIDAYKEIIVTSQAIAGIAATAFGLSSYCLNVLNSMTRTLVINASEFEKSLATTVNNFFRMSLIGGCAAVAAWQADKNINIPFLPEISKECALVVPLSLTCATLAMAIPGKSLQLCKGSRNEAMPLVYLNPLSLCTANPKTDAKQA